MTVSITDLLAPNSKDQIRATMVTTLKSLGIPADQWRPGGVFSTMLTVVATVFAAFWVLLVQAISAGFLGTSSGSWLTLVAYYVYGVTRPAATFASGALTLTNTGGGVYSYAVGAATFLNPTSGKTYTNATAIALGALATQTIQIACTTSGSAGSAAPGTITSLVTSMLGVTCSNGLSVVGQDAMGDPALQALCLNRMGASSVRGPRSAYAYAIAVAINAVTGAPVNINRQTISRSSRTGTVSIVIASPSGVPDPNDVAGVVTSIETGVPGLTPPFSGARPDCVTVTVAGATAIAYAPTLTVWAQAQSGVSASTIQTAIANAITAYIAAYPVGGVTTDAGTGLWGSGIEAAARGASSAVIYSIEGATDLALSAGQVATDGVTVVVRLVATS